MRVAVSGSGGRLGRALIQALRDAPYTGPHGPIGWSRRDLDLDRFDAIDDLLDAARVEVLVHAAAWTDVDGCAREPDLAMRRNGEAVGQIARACAARGIDLVLLSTNEVFDGRRTDGVGYGATDPAAPLNAYGASKLAGEGAARSAYARAGATGRLGIVRTAWLFGPPGNDFPAKIIAAGLRAAAADEAVRVVAEEVGTPTYAMDLAEAIAEIIGADAVDGIHHLTNAGVVSRAAWARVILKAAGIPAPVEDIPAAAWARASTPPAWGVLAPTQLPSGEPMRPWRQAFDDYLPILMRDSRATAAGR